MANWTEDQIQAITVQGKNILVSASAGSGKTAILVERVIRQMIQDQIDIDKILVVTFTNAAANELKERLLQAIYQKLEEEPKNIFLRRQIKLLSRTNITTMDSFCIKLVRSNFHLLKIDPNFKICDESMASVLKNNAMAQILEETYRDNEQKEQDVTLDLYKILEIFGGKEDQLITSLFQIYRYIQSFPYPFSFLEQSMEQYRIDKQQDLKETKFGKQIYEGVMENFQSLLKRVEQLQEEVRQEPDFKKHVELLEEDQLFLKSCLLNGTTWDTLYEILHQHVMAQNLRNKVANIALKDKIKDFRNTVFKKEWENAKKQIYETSCQIIHDNQIAYEYLKYLYDFLVKFHEEYQKQKEEKNLFEFDDIRHLALQLLIERKNGGEFEYTKIAQDLKEQFLEVYTDEYQDTNMVQETILQAVSKSNNRFIVGDIKQSIYKFIQARPEIFQEKYETYRSGKDEEIKDLNNLKIILAENFRSRKEVIDSINYIFEQIMSKQVGDCQYEEIETLKNGATWYQKKENQNYLTELNVIDVKLEEEKQRIEEDETLESILELKNFEKEAICIAQRIGKLKKEFQVYDPNHPESKDGFRKIRFSDIVILLRSIKTKGVILEETLKQYGIPSFSDASQSLFSSDELKLVLAFLKVIDNPYQDVEMISVMYSIIGKFTLDELYEIRFYFQNKMGSLYDNLKIYQKVGMEQKESKQIRKELVEKVRKFLDLMESFQNYAKIYSISELLIRLYKETNIYYQIHLQEFSDSKKANLNLLIDLARNFEQNGKSNMVAFIKYIDNLEKVGVSESQAKVLGDNEDVVKIMTIHKSKGLEFPVVLLADTSAKYMEQDLKETVVMHQELGIGIDVVDEKYHVSYPSVMKQAIKNSAFRELKSEELRVLYVALTRAKEKLILFGTIQDYDKYRENELVFYRDKKIDPTIILKNNNYLKNILMALKKYKDSDQLFDIRIQKFDQEFYTRQKNEKKEQKEVFNLENEIKKMEQIVKIDPKKKMKVKEIINNNLEFEYPFEEDVFTSNRVSVSQLKRESLTNKQEDDYDIPYIGDSSQKQVNQEEIRKKFHMPKCIANEEAYTPVRKGTLVHFVLEILDFNQIDTMESLKNYVSQLVEKQVISKKDVKHINLKKIDLFLQSDLGQEVKASKEVKKEEEFVVSLEKYSHSLIQGVIDLYYLNSNGNVVLVDFKTDRLEKEEEFIQKYKIQLQIYREAIEKLTDWKVEKVYIYSFHLDKKIEVKS